MDVVCQEGALLPLQPNSVETLVLWHSLEQQEHPSDLLREAYNALAPGGVLVVLCFNSLSLWGLAHLFSEKKTFPWGNRYWPRWQLEYGLTTAGFTLLSSRTVGFLPPWLERRYSRVASLHSPPEVIGQLLFPGCGAVSCLVAEKRCHAGLVEKLPWWKRQAVATPSYHRQDAQCANPEKSETIE
jgi:hypothetical protein